MSFSTATPDYAIQGLYPQSNGKIERWHKSLKSECIRPLTLEDARRLIQTYVDRYSPQRERVRQHKFAAWLSGRADDVLEWSTQTAEWT